MMLTITKALLKKKAVEYLVVGLLVSVLWIAAALHGCKGCKSNELSVVKTEFAQRDSIKQRTIDSLDCLHRADAQIIDSLLNVKRSNSQEYSEFKKTNSGKLKLKKYEIEKMSGDSLYRDVIRDLSRLGSGE